MKNLFSWETLKRITPTACLLGVIFILINSQVILSWFVVVIVLLSCALAFTEVNTRDKVSEEYNQRLIEILVNSGFSEEEIYDMLTSECNCDECKK